MCTRDERGPRLEIDAEASQLLLEFKGLCNEVKRGINSGRLVIQNNKITQERAERANVKMSAMLYGKWAK